MATSDPDDYDVMNLQHTDGKRKREDDDNGSDNEDEYLTTDGDPTDKTFLPNTEVHVPEDYQGEDESELSEMEGDSDEEHAIPDDVEEVEVYSEDQEPLPRRACYDEDIEGITKRLSDIAKKAHELFTESANKSKTAAAHKVRADQLQVLPDTGKLRVAILGDAGTGKSSLLNSLTDTPELAKSVSDPHRMLQNQC